MHAKFRELNARRTSDRKIFYRDVLESLNKSKIEYLVGGGHAFELYSGISRETKDLDLFVRAADVETALAMLADKHYKTALCHPHWLGKIYYQRDFIDVIFSSGNGVCLVDDDWFENSVAGEVVEVPVIFCPPEEMIWAKAFVMERERYDGADVAHLIRACAAVYLSVRAFPGAFVGDGRSLESSPRRETSVTVWTPSLPGYLTFSLAISRRRGDVGL